MEMSMVAEGYYATKSAHLLNEKNKKKTRLPIIKCSLRYFIRRQRP